MDEKRALARITSADIVSNEHGGHVLQIGLNYGDSAQCFMADVAHTGEILDLFEVLTLQAVPGRYAYALIRDGIVYGIQLPDPDGGAQWTR